ncbi:MAG: glycosyltransferase family 25 protein [Pseudooceanicola sp.]|nr:glycosyltransferase family 25 protein [Pseudooceanicola sp.]
MWPAHVINLAANTARMENSARELSRLGIAFERLDAVNGWAMDEGAVAAVYDAGENARRGKYPLVRPEIGCYLSHVEAWRRIAEGEAEGGFVFEDDIRAEDTLGEAMALLSGDEGRDWDMVKLFTFDTDPQVVRERSLGRFRLATTYRVPTCLNGYGLTRDAAAHLAARAIPFFRPVDEDQKFLWETGLRVATLLPPQVRVGDQQAATGTIGTERRRAGARQGLARLRQALHGALYQWRYRRDLARHWKGKA